MFELELEPHAAWPISHSYVVLNIHASAAMAFRYQIGGHAKLWIVYGGHKLRRNELIFFVKGRLCIKTSLFTAFQFVCSVKVQPSLGTLLNMPSLTYPIALVILAASALADIHNVNTPKGFFEGPQSGIGSWYRASAGQDSTNGKSWCAYTYYNSDPVFAVVCINPSRT
jgi:hypothetical protein